MKEFISNLMTKFNKKVLWIFAAALGGLSFLVGLLAICSDAKYGCGAFINYVIAAVLLFVLAYEINKEDKKKCIILVFAIISEFIFLSAGNGIQSFAQCSDVGSGIVIATFVFVGLGDLALFVAGISILLATLNDKVNKKTCHFIGDCAFFVAAFLFVIAGILSLCQNENGISLAVKFMSNLFYAAQAVFFAFETYNLLIQNEEETKAEVKVETTKEPEPVKEPKEEEKAEAKEEK